MKFLIAALLFVIPLAHGKAIQAYKNSINNDPNFEKLLRDSIEKFRDLMMKGDPGFFMPVLDPFKYKGIIFPIRHDVATLNLTLLEVTVEDASKFTIQNLQADTDMTFHVEFLIPQITSFGVYDIDGTVVQIFPLWGNGNFSINLTDINIVANGKFISTDKTLELSSLDLHFKWDQLIISADNFMGSGDFSKAVLKMLSKLAKNMFEMHKEEIFNYLNPLFVEAINEIIQHYSGLEAAEIHLLS